MKIIVLGGGGLEGGSVSRDLAKSGVSEIVLADYNEQAAKDQAKAIHEAYPDCNLSAVYFDASDYEGTVQLLKDQAADVVINMVGPYYVFGVPMVKAAIEAGINYVDINDDYAPSVEVLDTLNDSAKEAGVTVIIGCGATPGLSNMLGKYASLQMDQIEEIYIDWLWPTLGEGGIATLQHGFEIFSGNCIQFIDGDYREIEAGSGTVDMKSDDGKYDGRIHYLGHGEPATMPRYLDGVQKIVNRGGLMPVEVDDFFINAVKVGLHEEPVEIQGEKVDLQYVAAALMARQFADYEMENPDDGFVRITAKGQKDQEAVEFVYEYEGNGSHLTSWPTSIVAQMVAEGDIDIPGANTPEVLEKEALEKVFEEFQARDIDIKGLN